MLVFHQNKAALTFIHLDNSAWNPFFPQMILMHIFIFHLNINILHMVFKMIYWRERSSVLI